MTHAFGVIDEGALATVHGGDGAIETGARAACTAAGNWAGNRIPRRYGGGPRLGSFLGEVAGAACGWAGRQLDNRLRPR